MLRQRHDDRGLRGQSGEKADDHADRNHDREVERVLAGRQGCDAQDLIGDQGAQAGFGHDGTQSDDAGDKQDRAVIQIARERRDRQGADARAQSGLAADAIADATDRVDHVAGRTELLAQAADVGVDGAGLKVWRIIPDVGEEFLARLHPALPLEQQSE